jgi:hypothetical protein
MSQTVRQQLGEIDYLKWEAAQDANFDYSQLTAEEREELEEQAEAERRAADLEAWEQHQG